MKSHVIAQGASGKFWCCECITKADSIAQLTATECHPEYLED